MFIVFEGIDGSGKTTISNRVSERLRATGLRVTHVREEGTFRSTSAQAIRELGRDARNLMLSPISELLLYVARDGQSLEEMVIPALATSDVVIADRYLYSAELLATAGRGLPASVAASIVGPVAARALPDLAILIDVPSDIARARRKVSKLLAPDRRSSSRKGLAGGGLQVKLQRAHRELAEANPDLWLIVDNDDVDLDAIVDSVTAAIAAAAKDGVAAGLAEGRRRLGELRTPAPPPRLSTSADARAALLAWVEHRAAREPNLAAYVLAGFEGDDVDAIRAKLADRAPIVIAHGLAGLDDAASWRLRDQLAERAPDAVARSLSGLVSEEAYRYRRTLAAIAPEGVVASLGGLDDDEAWALRDQLAAVVPDSVTASLAHLASPRADAERRAWLARLPANGPKGYLAARAGARMVAGRSDDRAWKIRELVFALAPVEAIAGMRGDDSARAWQWRHQYAERAMRPVADSLIGMTQPAAWELRERLAGSCREVFTSMAGLDDPEAWALREEHAAAWPSTVCKSLGPLAVTERGQSFIAAVLGNHHGVSLWRNTARTFSSVAVADDHHPARALPSQEIDGLTILRGESRPWAATAATALLLLGARAGVR